MKGCLLAPFRLLGCLTLILILLAGWLYRDRLGDWGRELLRKARHQPAVVAEIGTPSPEALTAGRRKLAALGSARDSVTLSADEAASLLSDVLGPYMRGTFDSIRVRLTEGNVEVRAKANTARLPSGLLGPLGMAVGDYEPMSASGPLAVAAPGRGAWRIEALSFRSFPLPSEVVPRMMEKVTGDTSRAVPVPLPRQVRAVAVHGDGVTFYSGTP
ncbi:MAG TPA: hypothetical protein VFL88_05570 [Gemmatimonadales bacterium]|nr:hypothetical protein [Gemmatimonadales bacterium]